MASGPGALLGLIFIKSLQTSIEKSICVRQSIPQVFSQGSGKGQWRVTRGSVEGHQGVSGGSPLTRGSLGVSQRSVKGQLGCPWYTFIRLKSLLLSLIIVSIYIISFFFIIKKCKFQYIFLRKINKIQKFVSDVQKSFTHTSSSLTQVYLDFKEFFRSVKVYFVRLRTFVCFSEVVFWDFINFHCCKNLR